MRKTGIYETYLTAKEQYKAFIPDSLPPDYPREFNNRDLKVCDSAHIHLGRLDGLSTIIPDTSLFLYFYVRKEALISSQIKGTQSSFSDLLLYERDEKVSVPLDEIKEVSNYIKAIDHGIKRIE